jgi:hypothetical protein
VKEKEVRKMQKTKPTLLAIVAIMLLCMKIAVLPVLAQSSGTSEGTATVLSTSPSITSPELWNEAEDTDKNSTDLDVNTEYRLNFTVADSNQLGDLDNITIRIYHSVQSTENASNQQIDHYSITWVESTDTWAIAPTGYIDTGDCADPGTGSSSTSYEFRAAFDLSKVANHTSTGGDTWKISIFVWDDSANADSDKTLMFDVAFYAEISITDTTHAWSSLSPSDTDQTVDGDGDVDFTVITNAKFDIQAKGNQSYLQSAAADQINLGNLTIHYDTLGSSVALTTSWADVGGLTDQSAPTDEGSATATYVTLWLDVPNVPAGSYEYKLEIQVVEH